MLTSPAVIANLELRYSPDIILPSKYLLCSKDTALMEPSTEGTYALPEIGCQKFWSGAIIVRENVHHHQKKPLSS